MRSTGVVRKIDNLGRIVLPIEIRKTLGINVKDPLAIFVEKDQIILQKYEPCDIFTGSMEDLVEYQGKKISKDTIRELVKLLDI